MTGLGIIGGGVVADYHRQAIAANAEHGARLVAVAHHRPARFDELSRRFGVPCVTEDELLAREDVDVVCICTPSGLHAEQAVRAAEAGKHVLVEKPVALTLADADAVVAAAAAHGVRAAVVLQRRAEPTFRRVADAVSGGELGRVTLATVTIPYRRPQDYFDEAPWRGTWALDGGGVLMNQGIHLVDLLVWYLGDPVDVLGRAATLAREIEVEDTAVAALRFDSGALATIAATTTASPGSPHRLELYGTAGFIRVEGEAVVDWQLATTQEGAQRFGRRPRASGAGAAADPRGISTAGHAAIVRDLLESLRTRRPPLVDAREARRSLAAVLAVYEAAGLLPRAVASRAGD